MIVQFTPEELADFARVGRERQDIKTAGARDRLLDTLGGNDKAARAHALGNRAEAAVAQTLGLEWDRSVTKAGDDGADLELETGWRLDVKYRDRRDADLMVLARRNLDCHALVLVIPTDDPRAVEIAGAITLTRFNLEAQTTDFGYGPTRWVAQSTLTPWAVVRPILEEAPR